jgi:siroheme synthase-like protein
VSEHYVACLDLEGRACVVVGETSLAEQKAAALRAAGAAVKVVAAAAYEPVVLESAWLVVVATDDEEVQRRISREAEARRIFCNVADVPELCSFILPALHRQGPIIVAVSTGGASPALAQWLRDRFAAQLGSEHERLAEELRRLRPWARLHLPTYAERRDYFRALVAKALG